jgi:hypothetical protein
MVKLVCRYITDLESAKVTGGFWTHQIWVFGGGCTS